MRIITLNANGIRSAAAKGFFQWLSAQGADVVCVQETKAHIHQLAEEIREPRGYHAYYHDAQKKGYSGVALFSRQPPKYIHMGLGWPDVDQEARYIEADFGDTSVVSLYIPSGTSGDERQQFKYGFMERFGGFLKGLRRRRREYIICGDWNIAHKPIDLKNWRGNQKNSGFLPEERAWMDHVFDDIGLVDAFRVVNQSPDQYTWWSNRGQAWAKNVGWRIDYQVITPGMRDRVRRESIYKDTRFSDHAPLIIDYEGELKG
jgi:exodeoxyribonuclease-3